MATIMNLPNEIIFTILEDENISLKDADNFSSTCTKFQRLIDHNFLKKIYAKRWPSAKASYEDEMYVEFCYANVEDLKESIKCMDELRHYLSRMSEKYYYHKKNKYIVNDIKNFLRLHKKKHPLNLFVLFDELIKNIYKQDPCQSNLTKRYYSIKIFQNLNRDIFNSRWKKIDILPIERQRLEDIIVIFLQWYHPDKFITDLLINKFIDNIVKEVLQFLKNENSPHPILSISRKQFSIWKNFFFDKNYWNEKNAKSIKWALDKIIVKFDSYKSWMEPNKINTDPFYRRLNLRQKINYRHLFWLLMYICAGRRLGLYFEILRHSPQHSAEDIHLAWQPSNCKMKIQNEDIEECFTFDWIDDQDSVKISDIKKCQIVLTSEERFPRLIRSTSKMDIIKSFYSWVLSSSSPLFAINNFISSSINDYDVTICTPTNKTFGIRSPNLKYAIGLVVRHRHKFMDNIDDAGVIIGWHNKCQIERFQYRKTYCTPKNIKDEYMQKHNIDDWKSQPYYVLLMINNLCYVPQYAIASVCTEWINNSEVGRYFCKFEGTHYVPNRMLEKHYPNDAAVVREILSRNKL